MSATEPLATHFNLLLIAARLLHDHESFHSDFQLKWLLIFRSGGTAYGCYKQALLEIETRLLAIKSGETNQCEVAAPDCFGLEHLRNQLVEGRQVDLIRELTVLCDIANRLKAIVGTLDRHRRNQLEEELWTHRIKKMAALDFITNGHLSRDTLELILAMPIGQRSQILREVLDPTQHDAIISNCLSYTIDIEHDLFQHDSPLNSLPSGSSNCR
jgi:hypothetical protein